MPFVSARRQLGEINLLGNRDNCYVGDSRLSVDSEENVADIFVWVYSMDITENDFPDISDTAVCEN